MNNIQNFRLAWRWTSPENHKLSKAVLDQLVGLDSVASRTLAQRHRALIDGKGLVGTEFRKIRIHPATGECGQFLKSLGVSPETVVSLSWDEETALRTTWNIFEAHWEAFCYPSSDDVTISPESESWVLYYSHEEQFEYGKKV